MSKWASRRWRRMLRAWISCSNVLWRRFFRKSQAPAKSPSQADLRQLDDAFLEWMQLEHVLRDDITELFWLLDRSPDSQVLRRAVVRSGWAFKEGCLNGLAAFVGKAEELSGDFDDGRPPDSERTLERMKATLKWCGRGLAPGWQPDFSTDGWLNVRRSLSVRDRLMHPRTAAQLQISNEEMEKIKAALAWFLQSIVDLQTRALARSRATA
jgi:hypothetical protein